MKKIDEAFEELIGYIEFIYGIHINYVHRKQIKKDVMKIRRIK